MKRLRPSIKLTCDECGSSMVYWDPETEEFICDKCDHHIFCEELAEKLKYELDLVDFRLFEIPDWVFTKKYLKEIDLSAEPSDSFHFPFINRLSVIPDKIGRLKNLEEFSIAGNAVGKIPPGFGKLKKLKSVTFGGNYIEEFPLEICHLKKLEFLNLYNNSIECLPPEIGGLKNLRILSVGKNRLREIPPEIGALKNLEELLLDDNKLESLPDEIGLLTNLNTLKLDYNKLKTLPKTIVNLPKLKHLTVYGNATLESPPIDVAEEGINAIRNWFNKFGEEPDKLKTRRKRN